MSPTNTDSAPIKVEVSETASRKRRFGSLIPLIILSGHCRDVTSLAAPRRGNLSRIAHSQKIALSAKMVMKKVVWVLPLVVALALVGCSRQQSDWEKTRAANTTDAYELFLKKYPSGEFSAQAQARVKELYEERDWQKARDTDTPDAYQAFLKQYPEGKWTEEARIRVENFTLARRPRMLCLAAEAAAPRKPLKAAPRPRADTCRGVETRRRGARRKPAPRPNSEGALWRAIRRV